MFFPLNLVLPTRYQVYTLGSFWPKSGYLGIVRVCVLGMRAVSHQTFIHGGPQVASRDTRPMIKKCGRNTLSPCRPDLQPLHKAGKLIYFNIPKKMSPVFTHSITVADMYSSHLIRPSTMSDRRITNPSKAPPAPQHRTLPLSLRGINRDAGRRYIWVRNEDRGTECGIHPRGGVCQCVYTVSSYPPPTHTPHSPIPRAPCALRRADVGPWTLRARAVRVGVLQRYSPVSQAGEVWLLGLRGVR